MENKDIILYVIVWGIAVSSSFYSVDSWIDVLVSIIGFGIALFLLTKVDEYLSKLIIKNEKRI